MTHFRAFLGRDFPGVSRPPIDDVSKLPIWFTYTKKVTSVSLVYLTARNAKHKKDAPSQRSPNACSSRRVFAVATSGWHH